MPFSMKVDFLFLISLFETKFLKQRNVLLVLGFLCVCYRKQRGKTDSKSDNQKNSILDLFFVTLAQKILNFYGHIIFT